MYRYLYTSSSIFDKRSAAKLILSDWFRSLYSSNKQFIYCKIKLIKVTTIVTMFTSQASGTQPRLATVRPAGQGHSRLEGRSLPPPPQTRAPFFPDIIFLQCPQERGKVCIDWRHSFTLCRLWRSTIPSFFFAFIFLQRKDS